MVKKKSRRKYFLISILVIALLGFGAYRLGFRSFLIGKVQKELLKAINKDPSRLYDISCASAEFNLTTGNIMVHDVHVEPRHQIVDSIYAQNEVIRMLLELHVEQISLTNLNVKKLLMDDHVVLEKIEIRSPELDILLNPSSDKAEDKSLIQEIFIPEFNLTLQDFEIINASANVQNVAFEDSMFLSLDSFYLHVDQIQVDSTSFDGPIEKNFNNLYVEARNLRSPVIDIYQFEADMMTFDLEKSQFRITNINLIPTMDKHQYGQKNGVESDWFQGSIKEIEMRQFDLALWHETGKINYEKLSVIEPDMYVFRDKRLPDPPSKLSYLPQHALRSIPITFLVDSIEIKTGNVVYEEHHEGYDEASRMEINQVYGTGYQLTNDSIYWASNGNFQMDLMARLWNNGKLNSSVDMPLYSQADEMNIQGSISALKFEKMNEFFQNTLYMKFETGILHHLNFNIVANENIAKGSLDINYNDLKIEVLGLPNATDKSSKKKNKFYSFLANTVVPKNYHPQSRHYKQGYISVERPKDKSIFKYMAVCMQDGIMSCMVANAKRKKRKERKRRN